MQILNWIIQAILIRRCDDVTCTAGTISSGKAKEILELEVKVSVTRVGVAVAARRVANGAERL
jgi:hypothetical protein